MCFVSHLLLLPLPTIAATFGHTKFGSSRGSRGSLGVPAVKRDTRIRQVADAAAFSRDCERERARGLRLKASIKRGTKSRRNETDFIREMTCAFKINLNYILLCNS